MSKVLSQAFGGSEKKDTSKDVKVNDMKPDQAVNSLNNFFGTIS